MTEIRRYDYHVHYDSLSDQTARESGTEAIDIACAKGVDVICLLSRAEMSDNIRELIDYGYSHGVEVIPGVEQIVRMNGKRADIVCLGFDPDHHEARRIFGKEEEKERNKSIAFAQKEFLENVGFQFDGFNEESSDILKRILSGEVAEKAIRYCEILTSSSNSDNRDVLEKLLQDNYELWNMVQEKYSHLPNFQNISMLQAKFLYLLYFDLNKPGYDYAVEKVGPLQRTAADIIKAVHNAGGVVLYSPEGGYDQEVWERIKDFGADGIMAWHADKLGYNKGQLDIPLEVIVTEHKNGKLILGGSDYQKKDWEVGTGNNNKMAIGIRRHNELMNKIKMNNGGKIPWRK